MQFDFLNDKLHFQRRNFVKIFAALRWVPIISIFGAHIAERKRLMDLNKEGYVQVALRVDDVQRWWDGEKGKNEFLGLHVQALYKNENLAVHPQPDLKSQDYIFQWKSGRLFKRSLNRLDLGKDIPEHRFQIRFSDIQSTDFIQKKKRPFSKIKQPNGYLKKKQFFKIYLEKNLSISLNDRCCNIALFKEFRRTMNISNKPLKHFGFLSITTTDNTVEQQLKSNIINHENLMHLELTTFDEYSRKKRSYQEVCTREMNEPSCCLYSLVVDFDQAGWDFVIAPKVYDAHMCSGECRLHYKATL
ncbi:unnamed protein product [Dracunculus medinensis]|uniref:TGF_BETA_2 domain-containing protein n=1 Tax=Dracunculus medinensis TaxID=318479 RepID=A0A0N4U2A5_DRAME|nr:unnamed protein product [Dracunculus medinensis]